MSARTVSGWVEVKAFGLTLAVSGNYTPRQEGVPAEFEIKSIEHKGVNIIKYVEAFGVYDEIDELASLEARTELNPQ